MNVEETLTQRFIEAIRKSYKPCPIIGTKWFIFHPDASPPYFQFNGIGKLAKATGLRPATIAKRVLAGLSLKDLDATAELTDDFRINVRLAEDR